MKYIVLLIALLWAFVGRSQGTTESCRAMGLYFCTECENTDLQCHLCTSGYTLKSDKTGCLKCTDTNCIQCSINTADTTKTDCEVCAAGYYLKDADKTCVSCGITNCNTCHMGNDSVVVCDQCDSSYYKVSDSECAACDTSCLNCTSTSCLACKSSTYVISGADSKKCAACPGNCKTCITGDSTTITKCTTCNDGYYVSNDACAACPGDQCKTCPDGTCNACLDNFYLDGSSCSACSYQCLKCSDGTTCDTCVTRYTTKGTEDKSCDECPTNCNICTPEQAAVGKCTTCMTGYALDSVTSKCVACSAVTDCESCTVSSGTVTCTACKTDFKKDDNKCYKCPDNCPLANCVHNETAVDSFKTYCETCNIGYTTNNNLQCVSCDGCDYCSWNDTRQTTQCQCSNPDTNPDTTTGTYQFRGTCDTDVYVCKEGYYYVELDDTKFVPSCKGCIVGCSHCNTTSECFECKATDYATKPKTDGTCYKCSSGSSNCLTCSSNDGTTFTCNSCKSGYFTKDAGCSACPANCDTCSDATSCTTCKASAVKGADGKCYACPASCTTCTVDTDGVTSCTTCVDGYEVNNGACEACPANCLDCEYVDGALICSDDKCATGYQKLASDKLCHACPNNCAACTESTSTPDLLVCGTCQSQFTLNEYACGACPAKCAKCSAKGANIVCDTCDDGYYMDSDKVCQSTATFGTECLDASDKPPSCSLCQEGVGAELVSDKCYVNCYTCGSLTNNVPTSTIAQCNAQGNEYPDKAPCEYGCYIAIKYDNNEMILASRGCVVNATCLSDGVEQCTDTGPSQNCFKCCDSGELCNGNYWNPSCASASHVIGIITMSVTILAAYVIN
ncbi:hypothetical protein LSH36_676g00014 [Paralvinella palmiformis]|uniref:EGF-like domain-containing protein n=1 Tax=Paralvinella palmiformis TaxID=53620 RepID=A0AAD9MTS8_9ANNE|nr:hypothetical protein LSH36_676g00014 [Paralvinella palmiformis]